MTAKKNLFTVLSSLLMVFAVATFALAQDTVTTAKQGDVTVGQDGKEGKRFGHRGGKRGGRGERGGKHGMGRGGHRGGFGGGMRGFHALNLTEDQKTQMKALHESFKTGNEGSRQEMHTLMGQKRDKTITAEGQTRLTALRDQMKVQHEQLRASSENILTAEQKTQLETMKAERKQKMEERRQKWQERKAAKSAGAPAVKTN